MRECLSEGVRHGVSPTDHLTVGALHAHALGIPVARFLMDDEREDAQYENDESGKRPSKGRLLPSPRRLPRSCVGKICSHAVNR